jgi:acyl-CoA hydrolase
MEIYIDVWVQNLRTGVKHKSNEAISTFVALDDDGKTCVVPELIPETDEEKSRHAGALRRKQLSLILAKRMKPKDANELKALFLGED